MATMYDRMRDMTTRRLKPISQGGSGLECSLQRKSMVYNPVTDMNEMTVVAYAASGIRASFKQHNIDGELVRQGDVKLYLSPVLVDGSDCPTPQTVDQVLFNGKQYIIVNVKEWNFAATSCGWCLQLRAA